MNSPLGSFQMQAFLGYTMLIVFSHLHGTSRVRTQFFSFVHFYVLDMCKYNKNARPGPPTEGLQISVFGAATRRSMRAIPGASSSSSGSSAWAKAPPSSTQPRSSSAVGNVHADYPKWGSRAETEIFSVSRFSAQNESGLD